MQKTERVEQCVDHYGILRVSAGGGSVSLGYIPSFISWVISTDVILSFVKQATLLLTYESEEKRQENIKPQDAFYLSLLHGFGIKMKITFILEITLNNLEIILND